MNFEDQFKSRFAKPICGGRAYVSIDLSSLLEFSLQQQGAFHWPTYEYKQDFERGDLAMAAEFREAVAKVGSNTIMCHKCRPYLEHQPFQTGLWNKTKRSVTLGNLIILSNSLTEITNAASHCWVCAWLHILLASRCSVSMAGIDPAAHGSVRMGFKQHVIRTYEKGKTYINSASKQRELLRIAVWLDLRSLGKGSPTFLNLQHSEQHPIVLTDLLDRTNNLDWPAHTPYTTRIRSAVADLRLLKRWKEKCLSSHSNTCQKNGANRIAFIRLIDVVERRLVVLPGNLSWIALSYCWGGPQAHALSEDRLTKYQCVGALIEDILPPVIADAMVVTGALGERYLWVDSMCIVQDNELDKIKFSTIMDAIYDYATVTIINAATDNANSSIGLSGIRDPSQRRTHESFRVNGVWLAESLDPGHGSSRGYLEGCAWSTRGWTFQEGILSRRCLIFTIDQIFWHCRKSSWCEGSFWERDDELQIYRHHFNANPLTTIQEIRDNNWLSVYISILRKYSARSFTLEDDRLHALTGIHRAIERVTGEKFFWGTPRTMLEHGMTFEPFEPAMRRECHHRSIDTQGNAVSSPFPSWSWIGWLGVSSKSGMSSSAENGILGLQFYGLDEQGEPKRMDLPKRSGNTEYQGTQQRIRYPPDAVHDWMDKERRVVEMADIPPAIVAQRNLMPSLLCFWTSVAKLKIERRGWDDDRDEHRMIMSQGSVEFAGLGGRMENLSPPEHGLFIVISGAKLNRRHGGHLTLKLLLVEVCEPDGPVYKRKPLVTEVKEADWERLNDRRWEMVILS